ncbi:acetyltransferase (GNAT) family protein [Prosthecobacter fusiformis]|uniref:Acetyltransferase (GNAT) family protein n=1 Tax=Prosthecobacter fusiformis TaxID=48464 RepID=A0A4R7SS74_9BACT|nr:GNAT family protein [Prosthecobacter fusiformis]TDU81585.1 acetyltransferase (GNAT) family protein [Prosthecobacter fusiformis]
MSLPSLVFAEISPESEGEAVASFLSCHTWPFHARSTLTVDLARKIKLGPAAEVRAFWINEHGSPVGIVRIMDLDDSDDGSVMFDLRLAGGSRGRGIGRAAVAWLVVWLFAEYPALFRIEAATRIDNHAMRRVLELNHFVLEGQLRQTWRSEEGIRHDTALYGRLRHDA